MPGIDQPCESWVTASQVRGCKPCGDVVGTNDTIYADAALVASTWLWRLTGRRFSGQCTETVRPVPRCYGYSGARYRHLSNYDGGGLYNFDSRRGTYGWPSSSGRGEGAYEVTLGNRPVREVTQVKIDGAVLSPAAYRIDDSAYLVRQDGQPWPSVNDFTVPDASGPGTWEVTFIYGDDPPPDGIFAATVMACEVVLAHSNNDKCRLPRGVQNMVRQGLNLVMLDPARLITDGIFGIPEIDNFVRSVNPNRLVQRSTVVSVDIPRAVRRTGTAPGS